MNGDIADCVQLGAVMLVEPRIANEKIKNEILKKQKKRRNKWND